MIFYLEIADRANKDITAHSGAHGNAMTRVQHLYDQDTSTFTYVVSDPNSGLAAVVDPVLNLQYASGTLGTRSAGKVVRYVRDQGLSLQYILKTHIHADHLSSAPYIREQLGGKIVIGTLITTVQETFTTIFAEGDSFRRDGSQFYLMLSDGDARSQGHGSRDADADTALFVGQYAGR